MASIAVPTTSFCVFVDPSLHREAITMYEHWLEQPEILRRFARHFRTGEPMPDSLSGRLTAAQKFNQGFATVEYAASALVDLGLHERASDGPIDVVAFEKRELERLKMPEAIAMRHRTPHFQHIFSGGGYAVRLLQLPVVRSSRRRRLRSLRGGGRPVRSRPRGETPRIRLFRWQSPGPRNRLRLLSGSAAPAGPAHAQAGCGVKARPSEQKSERLIA